MDEKEIKSFRSLLVERRDQLIEEGDVEIEPGIKDQTSRQDEDTQPLNEMNQVIASRRNKNRLQELQRVENALKRLDANPDEFGECRDCGDEIPRKRLEVMPWAAFCVDCQDARSSNRGGRRRRHLGDYIE